MATQPDGTNDDRMNIVLTIDSGYVMSAAVTLCSIAENVQGHITLYIIDCGIAAEDRPRIETSLPTRPDITILFVDLPSNAIASELGVPWARIDAMKELPIERAIFLDADVLVRKDLRALWKTDLGGHPLAAVPEIGRRRNGQFNSGVLLVDVAKIRTAFVAIERLCYELTGPGFHDQDPLNVNFKDDWVALGFAWNAQGLGTYAGRDSGDGKICSEETNDPAIVNFTGPVHPSLGDALDFFQQPVTAKPWGYMVHQDTRTKRTGGTHWIGPLGEAGEGRKTTRICANRPG